MLRRKAVYGGLLIFAAYEMILYNERITLLIFLVLFIFPILTWLIAWFQQGKIQCKLTSESAVLRLGDTGTLILTVVNQSWLPVTHLDLTLEYENGFGKGREKKQVSLTLLPRSSQTASMEFEAQVVGEISVTAPKVYLWDYSGIHRLKKKCTDACHILVLPQSLEIEGKYYGGSRMLFENEAMLLKKPGNEVTEVLNIRDYIPGDRLSQVHWKLSRKQEHLMVKEYCKPRYYYPVILLEFVLSDSEHAFSLYNGFLQFYMTFAMWHILAGMPFETGYQKAGEEAITYVKVMSEEELYFVLQEFYRSVGGRQETGILSAYHTEKAENRYSNVVLLTMKPVEQEITAMLGRTDFYLVQVKEELSDAKQTANTFGSLISEQTNQKAVIASMEKYLRGGQYEG